jgi:type IV secretion system protein VirB10
MPGTDHHGVSGITGKVNNHWGRILSAAVLSSVLNIGARLPTQRLDDADSQLIVEEFGQGINRAAQEVIRRELRILPTVTVPGGTRINLMTNRDINLQP